MLYLYEEKVCISSLADILVIKNLGPQIAIWQSASGLLIAKLICGLSTFEFCIVLDINILDARKLIWIRQFTSR
jgi:hypothetical protein